MIDEHKIQEIETMFNNMQVPGEGVEWGRILEFGSKYNLYMDRLIAPLFKTNPNSIKLSDDQQKAWDKLRVWTTSPDPYFVLKGFAGTGKSFLMQLLLELKLTIYFTAPTNKATKVLSRMLGRDEAKTTYSQLGLKMTQTEETLQMEYGSNTPYMPRGSILVVDECSMIGRELFDFIEQTRERYKCKVLYVGDPAQLPPVGEPRTRAWKSTEDKQCRAMLKQVMRYDNQLLTLATRVRECIANGEFDTSPIIDDNDRNEGVFLLSENRFKNKLMNFGHPLDFTNRKVIAWRNKTVNAYNKKIRDNFGFENVYDVGDILLIAEPVEIEGEIIASIDDEFVVQHIIETDVKIYGEENRIDVWSVNVKDEDDFSLVLNIPKNTDQLDEILSERAAVAKATKNKTERRERWKEFWEIKKRFHRVRYGYAITSHRSQGSTYTDGVFIDQQDILSNSNKREAFRALYVAITRSSSSIYTF